ncbi:hypothetical protein BGZ94_007204 [Podila epigama]|nr:hypothetical protein BGZ94_007204 [Podila epigama]
MKVKTLTPIVVSLNNMDRSEQQCGATGHTGATAIMGIAPVAIGNGEFASFDKSKPSTFTQPRYDQTKDVAAFSNGKAIGTPISATGTVAAKKASFEKKSKPVKETGNEKKGFYKNNVKENSSNDLKQSNDNSNNSSNINKKFNEKSNEKANEKSNHMKISLPTGTAVNTSKPLPSPPVSSSSTKSTKPTKPTIISAMPAPHSVVSKPLWQHTMTTAEEISSLGLTSQDVQKQETIFELIYTEGEYLEDLKGIYRLFVEDLNVKMAEARRKKRSTPDKTDVRVFEKLSRLLSHIKDLWNGHQSLLNFLQIRQKKGTPVIDQIGDIFEESNFYMFNIYDSYFAQYSSTCKEFQYIMNGNSELAHIIKELLKSPKCKSLTLEGVLLKPIQRLQKYPLFFKDLMGLTPKTHPDYYYLEKALARHQRELSRIDDRIWVEEHNVMLADLQQRIKGLPPNFSLVEQHRYLILDGPVFRIPARQPSKPSAHKKGSSTAAADHGYFSPTSSPPGSQEWRNGFCGPNSPSIEGIARDDQQPQLQQQQQRGISMFQRPSQLDFHHLHTKPVYSNVSSPSSSSHSGQKHFLFPVSPLSSSKKDKTSGVYHHQRTFSCSSPVSPPSATTLASISSVTSGPGSPTAAITNSPYTFPNNSSPSTVIVSIPSSTSSKSAVSSSTASAVSSNNKPSVSALVANYNYLSSSFSNLSGHPRNISSSALHLPGSIKHSTDVEAEFHVFIFTDIVLWTKRVISRYNRKEGTPWNFKLVEPVSRLTSVCNTTEGSLKSIPHA